MERNHVEQFDDYDDLADLRIAALERRCGELLEAFRHNRETIRLLCGVVMGLYDDEERRAG